MIKGKGLRVASGERDSGSDGERYHRLTAGGCGTHLCFVLALSTENIVEATLICLTNKAERSGENWSEECLTSVVSGVLSAGDDDG